MRPPLWPDSLFSAVGTTSEKPIWTSSNRPVRDSGPTRRSAFRLEDVAHLELEHPRRIDVGECGDGDRRRAGGDELPERRIRRGGVAVDGLAAAEIVAVVAEIEALQTEENRAA